MLGAAEHAFARDGFERASLNAILAEAGVGKSSFFYHYADKEDLFAAVIEAFYSRVAERVGPLQLPERADDVWGAAADYIGRWGAAVDAEGDAMGLLRALQPMRRAARPRLRHTLDTLQHDVKALLERGAALGAVRSDLDVETLLALIEAVDLALDDVFHRTADPDLAAARRHRVLLLETFSRLLRPSATSDDAGP